MLPMGDLEDIKRVKYQYLRTLDTKKWDEYAATQERRQAMPAQKHEPRADAKTDTAGNDATEVSVLLTLLPRT